MSEPDIQPLERHVIKFKFLRHAMVHIGDGQLHAVPCRIMPIEVAPSRVSFKDGVRVGVGEKKFAQTATFDLEKEHEVEMLDERPDRPVKVEGMSDAYHAKLVDQAFEQASENKKRNDQVRARLYGYARPSLSEFGDGDNGLTQVTIPPAIKITHDPFPPKTVKDSSKFDKTRRGSSTPSQSYGSTETVPVQNPDQE